MAGEVISLAIVAHPDRREYVQEVSDRLQPEVIFWDDAKYGCDQNHLRAWDYLQHVESEWSVVVEDDAIPCNQFRQQLEMALKKAPSPVVSLYLGRGRPLTVDGFDWPNRIAAGITKDVCWLTAPGLASCVGVAIKTRLIPSMLWSVQFHLRDQPIDTAIGRWAKSWDDVAYTRPSLLDHRAAPTLIPKDKRVDGQDRDGLTQTAFTEEGKLLPEVRKAWLFTMQPTHRVWDKSMHAL